VKSGRSSNSAPPRWLCPYRDPLCLITSDNLFAGVAVLREHSLPMKTLITLLLFAVLAGARAEGPDDLYLQIYDSILEADTLHESGKAQPAAQKYREATAALKQLQAAHPDWNKKVVQYRLTYVAQKLQALATSPAAATVPGESSTSAAVEKKQPENRKAASVSPEPDVRTQAPVFVPDSAPPGMKILSRKAWKAKPPVSPMTPQTPAVITIHHTATKQNPKKSLAEKLQNLQAYSQREATQDNGKKKPAWPDVPYHFYIAVDGKVGEGREINFVGDTNTDYETAGHILVCLEGNFENEEPTQDQMKSTVELVRWLAAKYQVTPEKISAHKDHARTACPGKNLYRQLNEIRAGDKTK